MLTFDECREIVAREYDEPVAVDGWADDGACLVTLQSVADLAAQGIVERGGAWIVVRRDSGDVERWPHLDHLDRVRRMSRVRSAATRAERSSAATD
ncbi:hypothetical protein FVP74_08310 [Microbacterium saccharophilum]|uniref:Uncharacterized protein n=1 Tax=Microbacterium saccharophilum TaxID=1213358 RepID=A0A5C8I177_9MICO|nr:hypothetical protein [Microbacterium saccharophilum]TXK11334.1 hypothetical protein FVP74_08310 [Microbacterium saccharophilum]GEP48789.1 hypothetical protein MSA03_22970 [Microbacterium saccharophilum]